MEDNNSRRLIVPLHSILGNVLSIIMMVMIPFMLWDLFVLGLPSEGGLSMNPLRESVPTSFELIAMVSVWMASSVTTLWHSIKPVWDNYIKGFLDNIGRFLIIHQVYKWIKNKWFKNKENK